MINKDKIICDIKSMETWIDNKFKIDPIGRINKTTGKSKLNGAQHTINFQDGEFTPLFLKINEISKTYFEKYMFLDIWTNINLPNGCNGKHIHNGADIAGCFYIKVPENSGDIEFETGEKITPVSGEIYWWNANITHWVHTNKSIEPRYSVAFNIKNIS